MPIINTLEIYEDLKSQFNEDESKTLARVIEKSLAGYQKAQQGFLSTKDDIANLKLEVKEDMARLRTEVKEDIIKLRAEVKEDIGTLRTELANAKAEIIKWLFIFLIGQGATIVSILKFLK